MCKIFKKCAKFPFLLKTILRFARNFNFSNFLNFPGYARIRNFATLPVRVFNINWPLCWALDWNIWYFERVKSLKKKEKIFETNFSKIGCFALPKNGPGKSFINIFYRIFFKKKFVGGRRILCSVKFCLSLQLLDI